jgi:hypothetical protein
MFHAFLQIIMSDVDIGGAVTGILRIREGGYRLRLRLRLKLRVRVRFKASNLPPPTSNKICRTGALP